MPGTRRLFLAKLLEWIALGLVAVVTAIRAAPMTPGWPFDLQGRVVEHYVLLVWTLNALAVLGKVLQWLWNAESKHRIKAVLNVLHEVCFRDMPRDERFHNRVTLFKKKTSWWRPRLRSFCRAGENYQRGIPSFAVDDNDEGGNEGLCGQAWFRDATVVVNDLPEVPSQAEGWDKSDEGCARYVAAGFLSHAKSAGLRVKSRSILATPVRDFQGNKWGVLVVDSRSPGMIDDRRKDLAESIATALGKVLGRSAR